MKEFDGPLAAYGKDTPEVARLLNPRARGPARCLIHITNSVIRGGNESRGLRRLCRFRCAERFPAHSQDVRTAEPTKRDHGQASKLAHASQELSIDDSVTG